MAMNVSSRGGRGRRGRKLLAEMNVVPYIDVMLVLLIIFMVTAPLVTQGVKVELPKASSEPVPPSDAPPTIITVTAKGAYHIDFGENEDQAQDLATIKTRLLALKKYTPDAKIYLKGDRQVNYGRVVELMAALSAVGITDVGLLTETPQN